MVTLRELNFAQGFTQWFPRGKGLQAGGFHVETPESIAHQSIFLGSFDKVGRMSGDRRSQSEVVGVVLLTGVIVVLVAVVGVVIFAQFESETEREPRVTITSEVEESTLILTHSGGDRFDAGDVQVNLRGDFDDQFTLTQKGVFVAGQDSTAFEAGDIWEYDGLSSGELRVVVVDLDSETVIHQNRLQVS